MESLVVAEIPDSLDFRLSEVELGWFGPLEGLVDRMRMLSADFLSSLQRAGFDAWMMSSEGMVRGALAKFTPRENTSPSVVEMMTVCSLKFSGLRRWAGRDVGCPRDRGDPLDFGAAGLLRCERWRYFFCCL